MGWFTYDAAGNAKWYVGDKYAVNNGNTCTTSLYETRGATFDGTNFTNAVLALTSVGSATFSFATGQAATMTYSLKGVAGKIDLVRQPF